jgi:hypothetical protein
MKIVNDDDGKGCQLVDSDGNIIFLLYPREVVLSDSGKKAYDDVCALESLQRAPQNGLPWISGSLCLLSMFRIYSVNLEVVHHFVFPEFGIAVAMRPGDLLVFNPQYYHCLVHKEVNYNGNHVDATSFYLKTNMLGKNDNTKPPTSDEEAILAS